MNPPPPPPPPPPQPQPQPPPPPDVVATPLSHHPNLPPPPPPSLSAVLYNLSSLVHLSTSTLRSLPAPIATASASPTFLHCPFNPNHRLPPPSLFSHYLNCPSPLYLPHSFHYPLTLLASSTTTPVSLPSTSSDVSISLESYAAYNANFFYENCPGPITPSSRPPSLLSLPRDLYIECADFNEDHPAKEGMVSAVDFIRFLPSETWAIRSETEAWGGGLPVVYSSRILRAILRLRDCNLLHLNNWIVSTSPRYGVIIDFAMRDHVILLVRLCLKAIVREAFVLGRVVFGNGKLTNQSFECPVLVKAMTWLALQFSVLYGEVNGKFLAIDVLKECIVDSSLRASLFRLEPKVDGEGQESVQCILGEVQIDEGENIKGETVGNNMIFISQVAAAVAALHERSLIEEQIKAFRNPRPVSAYQRNMEHAYVSKIADEERLKRPDYRPIIEHDGFLRQKSNNQESNKVKTREELLAEQRDYKRRRMSYRGKKSKRNTLQVTRDIIEEYMDEIRQAGGIDDMSKTVEKTEALRSEKKSNTHTSATDVSKSRRNYEIPEDSEYDIERLRRDSSRDRGRQDPNRRSVERIRHDRDGRSHQRRSESHERKYHKRNREERERNNRERERDEREKTSRKRERHEDKRDHGDIREGKMNRNSRSSRHRELHVFDDRYDPAESRDFYEDDF